jgi:hypothetical protein
VTAAANTLEGATPASRARERRRAGLAGFVAVAGNMLGVAFLRDMPSAYRLARLDEWADAVRAAPRATTASSLCFALGLGALSAWVGELGRSTPSRTARAATKFATATALLDAAGTLLPLAVGAGAEPARRLLHASVALDALFNLGLGVGLVGAGVALERTPRLRVLAVAAGLTSIPVAAQAVWDPAAKLLVVAGPLWLTLIVATSLKWLARHENQAA